MAAVVPSNIAVAKGVIKTTWVLTGTDTGNAETAPQYPVKTVQVVGTFGGGTVVIQGSNDGGVTWTTLTDPQGNALSLTAAAIEKVQENPLQYRPVATVSVTSVTVIIVAESGSR